MKLSYEDIAVLLGKNVSTIRGQINSIKQKSGEGLISEILERSGRKRYFIDEKVKSTIFKKVKTRSKNISKVGKGKR